MSNFPFVIKILMLLALVIAGSIKGKFISTKEEKQSNRKHSAMPSVSVSFPQSKAKSL